MANVCPDGTIVKGFLRQVLTSHEPLAARVLRDEVVGFEQAHRRTRAFGAAHAGVELRHGGVDEDGGHGYKS